MDDLFGYEPPPPAPKATRPRLHRPKVEFRGEPLSLDTRRLACPRAARHLAQLTAIHREGWAAVRARKAEAAAAYQAGLDADRLAPLRAARGELLQALRMLAGRHPDAGPGALVWKVGGHPILEISAWGPGPHGVRLVDWRGRSFTSRAFVLEAAMPAPGTR